MGIQVFKAPSENDGAVCLDNLKVGDTFVYADDVRDENPPVYLVIDRKGTTKETKAENKKPVVNLRTGETNYPNDECLVVVVDVTCE